MLKDALRLLLVLSVTGICVLTVRYMGVTLVEIPEDGEQPVFEAGDCVAVNKWAYGWRLSPMKWFDYVRLGGNKIENGEWVAFNDPTQRDDSLYIDERNIFIGYSFAGPGDSLWIDACGHVFRECPDENCRFRVVRLPQKGEYVPVTPDNVYWYNQMINQHEGLSSTVVSDSLYVAEQLVTTFRFTNDYYWMSSANCHNMADSRTFGFVPDKYVIGRLSYILYSYDKEAPWYAPFRFERTMMEVGREL